MAGKTGGLLRSYFPKPLTAPASAYKTLSPLVTAMGIKSITVFSSDPVAYLLGATLIGESPVHLVIEVVGGVSRFIAIKLCEPIQAVVVPGVRVPFPSDPDPKEQAAAWRRMSTPAAGVISNPSAVAFDTARVCHRCARRCVSPTFSMHHRSGVY